MILADVNLHVYAFRADVPEHEVAARWMSAATTGTLPLAVTHDILTSFLRIVTSARIFEEPADVALAFDYAERLLERPSVMLVAEGQRYWEILRDLCVSAQVRGALVADARIAAIALENGLTLATHDKDFARFVQLKQFDPLSES